jgi:hypothetical protein
LGRRQAFLSRDATPNLEDWRGYVMPLGNHSVNSVNSNRVAVDAETADPSFESSEILVILLCLSESRGEVSMSEHGSGQSTQDIDTLSEWVEHISEDFRAQPRHLLSLSHWRSRRTLKKLSRLSTGTGESSTQDKIRLLVAAGVLTWTRKTKQGQILGSVSRPDLGSFATFALWPVVIAPRLPEDWYDALAEMSSPRIASVVKSARGESSRNSSLLRIQTFYLSLSHAGYAAGLRNLLDDLGDPNRGGKSFVALALCANIGHPPSKHLTARTVLIWLGTAAGAGVVEGASYDSAKELLGEFETLFSSTDTSGGKSSNLDHSSSDGHSGQGATVQEIEKKISGTLQWLSEEIHRL